MAQITFPFLLCLLSALSTAATSLRTIASSSDFQQFGKIGKRHLASQLIITLVIQFDKFPGTNYWDLLTEDSTKLVAFTSEGTYNESQALTRVERSFVVNKGQRYRFTMYDNHGNGLTKPSGFYYMMVGSRLRPDRSNIIFMETNFVSAKEESIFKAELPLTPAPTRAPPTVSPAPTSGPTSCSTIGDRGFSNAYSSSPKLATSATSLLNDAVCTQHTNYTSCTNEIREDCQWIFLTSSSRRGKCRIDPVTKCLQIGNCVCHTSDFHGGTEDFGNGIVFHAPISITPRDISKYSGLMKYTEKYTHPSESAQNLLHPLDTDFFISKVDFTARVLTYTFRRGSPVMSGTTQHNFAFKVHHLYMDTPLRGTIWNGIGMLVKIDSSGILPTLSINGVIYSLPPLKKWTCTQFVITSTAIFVAGVRIGRRLGSEKYVSTGSPNVLRLGKFSGELFDVRIYAGSLSYLEIREIGARCTNPNDPAVLKDTRDIDILFKREGCESTHDGYFPSPTTGGHTCEYAFCAVLMVFPNLKLICPLLFHERFQL
jgi:hypothetical protein